jgi:hypothetical protein
VTPAGNFATVPPGACTGVRSTRDRLDIDPDMGGDKSPARLERNSWQWFALRTAMPSSSRANVAVRAMLAKDAPSPTWLPGPTA